jgi:proline racemase
VDGAITSGAAASPEAPGVFQVRIPTVDTHAGGQPTRIVVAGVGDLGGDSMPGCRDEFRHRFDHLRAGLLAEPRGHAGMFGCVLVDPRDPSADFGAVFMHNDGYVDVSGHAAMGVITALVENGIVEAEGGIARVALDTPAGVIRAVAEVEGGRPGAAAFLPMPSWVGL